LPLRPAANNAVQESAADENDHDSAATSRIARTLFGADALQCCLKKEPAPNRPKKGPLLPAEPPVREQ
jgi:hypothetical protein